LTDLKPDLVIAYDGGNDLSSPRCDRGTTDEQRWELRRSSGHPDLLMIMSSAINAV
jgi:hypothetical protein